MVLDAEYAAIESQVRDIIGKECDPEYKYPQMVGVLESMVRHRDETITKLKNQISEERDARLKNIQSGGIRLVLQETADILEDMAGEEELLEWDIQYLESHLQIALDKLSGYEPAQKTMAELREEVTA
jgi:hypothetical protein